MTSFELGEIVLIAFPQTGTSVLKKRPSLVILDIGDADLVLRRSPQEDTPALETISSVLGLESALHAAYRRWTRTMIVTSSPR